MWVSARSADALGLEPDDLVGMSGVRPRPPRRPRRPSPSASFLLVDGAASTAAAPIDVRLRHADGTYRWFESSGSNQLADPSIRGLVISLRDITDRRAAEAALRMSEERNRSIVEAAADAIISVDAKGIIQSFNRAAELIFATTAADAIGRYYDRFLPEDSLADRAQRARGRARRPADRHDRAPRFRRTLRRARRGLGGPGRRDALLHRRGARHQRSARDGTGAADRGVVRRAHRTPESAHAARPRPRTRSKTRAAPTTSSAWCSSTSTGSSS